MAKIIILVLALSTRSLIDLVLKFQLIEKVPLFVFLVPVPLVDL